MTVSTLGNGGIANHIAILASELKAAGHEVDVLAIYQCEISPIELAGSASLGLRVGSFSDVLRGAVRLRQVISRGRYHVVHSHAVHANLLTRLTLVTMLRRPLSVGTVHTIGEGGSWLHSLLNRLTCDANDWIVGVSDEVVHDIRARGEAKDSQLIRIYNAVRLKQRGETVARSRAPAYVARQENVVLFVGRLNREKGVDVLADAWRQIRLMRPSARLWVVGDGPMRNVFEGDESITLWGWSGSVTEFMSTASVLVVPSRREGFGLVVAEGLASRISVVASDLDAVREVGGDCADYFERANVKELVAALQKRLINPADEVRLTEGVFRVKELFSPEVQAAQVLSLYNNPRCRRRPS